MTAHRIQPTDVIKIVGEYAPREDSRDGVTWKLIKNGMTVEQVQKAYAKTKFAKDHPSQMNFISHLRRKGVIKCTPAAKPAKDAKPAKPKSEKPKAAKPKGEKPKGEATALL